MGDTEFRGVKVDLDHVDANGVRDEECPISYNGEGAVVFVTTDDGKEVNLSGAVVGRITNDSLAFILKTIAESVGYFVFTRALLKAMEDIKP